MPAFSPNRILVLRGGAIGDFILTIPVLQILRKHWPCAAICLIAHPAAGRLALAGALADALRPVNDAASAELFAPAPLGPEWRDYLGRFDLIIDYLHDPDGIVAHHLDEGCRGRVIHHTPLATQGHAIDHFLAPLAGLGLQVTGQEYPQLVITNLPIIGCMVSHEVEAASSRFRTRQDAASTTLSRLDSYGKVGNKGHSTQGSPTIAIQPGSGSRLKNWPLDHFMGLGQAILETGAAAPLFICGECEDKMIPRLAQEFGRNRVVSGLDLVELAILLAGCVAYVGNDSGITQLAAALGVSTVAIFGPTNPATWGPRGPHVRIIAADPPTTAGLSDIPVAPVIRLIGRI